jgi:enterochelin esterase-like enzyme
MTAGEQESLLGPIRQFAAQLKAKGFAYEFHTTPGGHGWTEWNTQLPGCFARLFESVSVNAN